MRWHSILIALALTAALAACAAPAAPTANPTVTATMAPAPATTAPTAAPPTTAPTAAASAPPTAAPVTATAAFPVTVTDSAGRTLTLPRAPARIISLAPSNTEILFALGLGDRVVAVDEFSDYPPEAKAKATLGSYLKPDLEAVVAAAPDLALVTAAHLSGVGGAMIERGIPTLVVEPRTLPEVFDGILLVGRATGQTAEATRLVDSLRERSAAVTARVSGKPRPRTFLELSPQLHTAGPNSFLNDLLERAGGANIAAGASTPWPQLSQEALIQADPQVILLSYDASGETPAQVKARPGWHTLSAVKDGRVVTINPDLIARPGPRIVDGLEALASALHPPAPSGGKP
ncbi:MAG: cobalamin-binding protein [Chloroflexi bacterium]|nr:cobalamin-binding protein [Chloroflexota bacterium]